MPRERLAFDVPYNLAQGARCVNELGGGRTVASSVLSHRRDVGVGEGADVGGRGSDVKAGMHVPPYVQRDPAADYAAPDSGQRARAPGAIPIAVLDVHDWGWNGGDRSVHRQVLSVGCRSCGGTLDD